MVLIKENPFNFHCKYEHDSLPNEWNYCPYCGRYKGIKLKLTDITQEKYKITFKVD